MRLAMPRGRVCPYLSFDREIGGRPVPLKHTLRNPHNRDLPTHRRERAGERGQPRPGRTTMAAAVAAAGEADELEALIPPAAGHEDDGLAAAYEDLQDVLQDGQRPQQPQAPVEPGQEAEEAEEEGLPPPEALGAEALLERCQQRLRVVETALDDYDVSSESVSMHVQTDVHARAWVVDDPFSLASILRACLTLRPGARPLTPLSCHGMQRIASPGGVGRDVGGVPEGGGAGTRRQGAQVRVCCGHWSLLPSCHPCTHAPQPPSTSPVTRPLPAGSSPTPARATSGRTSSTRKGRTRRCWATAARWPATCGSCRRRGRSRTAGRSARR